MTTTTRVERDRAAEFQPERRRLFGRAAGLGLIGLGAGLLGERYPPLVWGGVALIALGIGLTVWARRGT